MKKYILLFLLPLLTAHAATLHYSITGTDASKPQEGTLNLVPGTYLSVSGSNTLQGVTASSVLLDIGAQPQNRIVSVVDDDALLSLSSDQIRIGDVVAEIGQPTVYSLSAISTPASGEYFNLISDNFGDGRTYYFVVDGDDGGDPGSGWLAIPVAVSSTNTPAQFAAAIRAAVNSDSPGWTVSGTGAVVTLTSPNSSPSFFEQYFDDYLNVDSSQEFVAKGNVYSVIDPSQAGNFGAFSPLAPYAAGSGFLAYAPNGGSLFRSIHASGANVVVSNGSGVDGDPSISVPDASTTQSGAVTTGAQSFSGSKSFGALSATTSSVGTFTATTATVAGTTTLNGTSNTAPNQTATSSSSLITRVLGDARYPIMAGANSGLTITTTGSTGIFAVGSSLGGNTRVKGEWYWSGTSRQSIMLSPLFSISANRDGKLELMTKSSGAYSGLWFYRAGGDSVQFYSNAATKAVLYQGTPYITVSGTVSVAVGDVITDGSGASGISYATRSATDIQLRWITGTKWYTTGSTVLINGATSAVTVTGGILTSAIADTIFIYDGSSDGTNFGTAIWNDTSATQSGFIRIDR